MIALILFLEKALKLLLGAYLELFDSGRRRLVEKRF